LLTKLKLYPPETQSPAWMNRFPSMLDGPMEKVFPVGGVPQENVDVEEPMSTVFCTTELLLASVSTSEAVPETVKSPLSGTSDFITVAVKSKVESGVTGIESLMIIGEPDVGVSIIV